MAWLPLQYDRQAAPAPLPPLFNALAASPPLPAPLQDAALGGLFGAPLFRAVYVDVGAHGGSYGVWGAIAAVAALLAVFDGQVVAGLRAYGLLL